MTDTLLELDGEEVGPLSVETWTQVREVLALSRTGWLTMNVVPSPTTVAPGEAVKILCLSSPTAPRELEALLLAILSRLALECKYKSPYGEESSSDWEFGSDPVDDEVLADLQQKADARRSEQSGFRL